MSKTNAANNTLYVRITVFTSSVQEYKKQIQFEVAYGSNNIQIIT